MKELYLFRHGETDWNVESRLQGHTDVPLNEKGRAQARDLAQKLLPLNFDLVASSDLSRALETARIALGSGRTMIVSAALREIRMGDFEGKRWADIRAEVTGEEAWRLWRLVDNPEYRLPNGESKRECRFRIKKFIEELMRNHPAANRIGLATHGASLRHFVHQFTGAPEEPVPTPHCCVYQIRIESPERWVYAGML